MSCTRGRAHGVVHAGSCTRGAGMRGRDRTGTDWKTRGAALHPGPMPHTPDLTIFFDGSCPLCRREIAHYLRRDRAGRLAALDIATDPAPLVRLGIAHDSAMAALHACDAQGRVLIGSDAFLAIWDRLPRWRRLSAALRVLPGARWVLERVYRYVAPRRARLVAPFCAGKECAR